MSRVDATQVAVLCYEVPDGSTTDVIKAMESIIDDAIAEARLEGAKAMQEAVATKAFKRRTTHDNGATYLMVGPNSGKTMAMVNNIAEQLMSELEADIRSLDPQQVIQEKA